MKKLWAIVVLAVFLMSMLPMAIAENTNQLDTSSKKNTDTADDETEEDDKLEPVLISEPPTPPGMTERQRKIEQLREARLKNLEQAEKIQERIQDLTRAQKVKLAALGRARLAEIAEDEGISIEEVLENYKLQKVDSELKFRKRAIAAEALRVAKQNYAKAVEQYKNAKQNFVKSQTEFRNWKRLEKQCEDPESEECQEAKEKAMEHAKNQLTHLADMILRTIEKIESKVEESEDVDADDGTSMLENLASLKEEVEALKAEIEAAETKEEIKEAGAELVSIWKKINLRLRKSQAKLFNGRMMRIINRADHLETKLDRVIARLEEKGVDTTEIEAKTTEFSEHVEMARDLYKEGKDLIEEAWEVRGSDSEEEQESAVELIKQAHEKFKEAHEHLKEAHTILQELVRMINAEGETFDEDEVEEEVLVEEIPELPDFPEEEEEEVEELPEEEETEEEEEETLPELDEEIIYQALEDLGATAIGVPTHTQVEIFEESPDPNWGTTDPFWDIIQSRCEAGGYSLEEYEGQIFYYTRINIEETYGGDPLEALIYSTSDEVKCVLFSTITEGPTGGGPYGANIEFDDIEDDTEGDSKDDGTAPVIE